MASAGLRIAHTFTNPAFDPVRVEGMVKSDPALILYLAQRIVDSGGGIPDDFRSDPRIEHPETVDVPAMFTVGQEFLIAWAYLVTGRSFSLHATAVVVMSLCASLTALGVYGIARELSLDARAGVLAAGLWALSLASYRTLGFVVVREDLAIPCFALHLAALARAWRTDSIGAWSASAVLLGLALATWHAMGFVVVIELAVLALAALWTRSLSFARPRSWIVPLVLLVFLIGVPVLRAKLLAPGSGDYAHVLELMLAKLRYSGELPADPSRLTFGARLLWQGPFATGSWTGLSNQLGPLLLALPLALAPRFRRSDVGIVLGAAALSSVLAVLVWRLLVLPALLLPVLAALLATRSAPAMRRWGVPAIVLVQALWFVFALGQRPEGWLLPRQTAEIAAASRFVREHVPAEAAIAADFVNSAALLANTGRRVVIQPKYETRRSRERIEVFVNGLYHATPQEFSRLLRERFDADYLLVDVFTLWRWRYKAGIPLGAREPPAGTAAAELLHPDPARYARASGFGLVYVSRLPDHALRIYRVVGGGVAAPQALPHLPRRE